MTINNKYNFIDISGISMRIGFTSQNFRTISGHAGKTRRFLVYEVEENGNITELERLDLPKEMAMHEFRGDDHPVFSFDLLITAGCGQGFINRLAQHQVQVVATSEEDPTQTINKLLRGETILPPQPHTH
jgi:predicted Fe-Mo cluster-binding NifX family protein